MDNETKNPTLFDTEELVHWKEHWKDMPEFVQEDLTPKQQIIVSFKSVEDRNKFAKLVGQKLTYKTQSIWYPAADIDRIVDKLYVDEDLADEQVQQYLDSRKHIKTPPSEEETLKEGDIDWFVEPSFEDPPEEKDNLTFDDDLLL